MHVLEYLHRNVKTVAMPTAMVAGALLCRPWPPSRGGRSR